jgi:hypothetical protein
MVLQRESTNSAASPISAARYQVILPVKGDYTNVREFVNDVLGAVPSAALEELALKRESIEVPELESRVRFTLFLTSE